MTDRPNILIIWGDDIGISNLSCYSDGVMGYRTPIIDRIAEPDPADGAEAVSKAHCVDPAPLTGCPHTGVDLQVQVDVRVPCPGGTVVHDRDLHLLHRDL